MKARSKVVEIEYRQWEIVNSPEGEMGGQIQAKEIVAWVNANGGEARYIGSGPLALATNQNPLIGVRTISTIIGWAYAAPGDCIVMGGMYWDPEDRPYPPTKQLRDFYPVADLSEVRVQHEWVPVSQEPATDHDRECGNCGHPYPGEHVIHASDFIVCPSGEPATDKEGE